MAVALLLGGVACSQQPSQDAGPSSTLGIDPTPKAYELPKGHLATLTYDAPKMTYMDALITGRLESVVDSGKVYFYLVGADRLNYGLVLPWGYSASKDGKTAYFEGIEVATVGHEYDLGGGHVEDGYYPWEAPVSIAGIYASAGIGISDNN